VIAQLITHTGQLELGFAGRLPFFYIFFAICLHCLIKNEAVVVAAAAVEVATRTKMMTTTAAATATLATATSRHTLQLKGQHFKWLKRTTRFGFCVVSLLQLQWKAVAATAATRGAPLATITGTGLAAKLRSLSAAAA